MDWLHDPVEDLRLAYETERRKPLPDWVSWEWIDDGPRCLRILRHVPPRLAGRESVVVYFHGGGWIVGSPATHSDITCGLSEITGFELISVDYGLAPKHRAMGQIVGGIAVLNDIIGRVPGRSVVLCGDSAGAAIALAVAQRTPAHLKRNISGVCSLYGGFGVFDSSSLRLRGNRADGLDEACLRRYWRLVNGTAPSPYAIDSLSQPVPYPCYLLAASDDPLLNDTLLLAKNLKEAGAGVQLDIANGAKHGFLHDFPNSHGALDALKRIGKWLTAVSAGAATGPGRDDQSEFRF